MVKRLNGIGRKPFQQPACARFLAALTTAGLCPAWNDAVFANQFTGPTGQGFAPVSYTPQNLALHNAVSLFHGGIVGNDVNPKTSGREQFGFATTKGTAGYTNHARSFKTALT